MSDTKHHPELLKALEAARNTTTAGMLLCLGVSSGEAVRVMQLLSTLFAAAGVREGGQMMALALQFGVLNAEIEEANRKNQQIFEVETLTGYRPTFEDRLLLFCEEARSAYRDRCSYEGSIEDQANVAEPQKVM